MTRGALRWNYSAMHPDVYLANGAERNVHVNAVAAWLWTRRTGIIAGKTAAALHGVEMIQGTAAIELIAKHRRRRPGIVVRQERIADDEIYQMGDLRVTTPARTALDLARRLPRCEALQLLDALAAKTGIASADIDRLMDRYRAARGIRAARGVVGLMDGGASSANQTRLRLALHDAGLPRPRTSIALKDVMWDAVLAIGWDSQKVGLEHDDDLARLNPIQRIERNELFQRLGWFRIIAHRSHSEYSVVHRVRAALRQRG